MKKLTRRSYNRKLIMLGLSLFISVGLITTGFSAWLISAVNGANATPPVTVGSISSDSVTVTIDQWTEITGPDSSSWVWDEDEILSFNAIETDNSGRVTYSNADAAKSTPEKLTMLISGEVDGAEKVKTLTLAIDLPESIYNAIQANYISVKKVGGEVLTNPEDVSSAIKFTQTKDANEKTVYRMEVALTPAATFSYTLTFEWGTHFGGKNPCEFYDSAIDATRPSDPSPVTVTGNMIADSTVIEEMNAFHETLTGEETNEGANAVYEGTITISVVPTLK